jgi:hypothetical protein
MKFNFDRHTVYLFITLFLVLQMHSDKIMRTMIRTKRAKKRKNERKVKRKPFYIKNYDIIIY